MMTSRQRLLGAMAHQPIDRVPISTYELVGWNETAWENQEPSYHALMEAIRENTDCIYMARVQWKSTPNPLVESRQWQEGNSTFTATTWHTPKGDLHSLYRRDHDVHTNWCLEHLLKGVEDIDKYLSMPWQPGSVDMTQFYAAQQRLGERGVMMLSISDPICVVAELFEMGDFLVYALTETDRILSFMDAMHERQMTQLKLILTHDVHDVIFRLCGPEYATPPYLGSDHFRLLVGRYLSEILTAVREAGAFARVHCHGKIGQVLDQIVDAGAQGLDPIEPPPDGDITLGEVKQRYGKQLCLFGNMELKELESGSAERIEMLVRTAMEEAKESSGFILMPTASPINVPLAKLTEQNYLCYIAAALKYGAY